MEKLGDQGKMDTVGEMVNPEKMDTVGEMVNLER